MRTKTSIDNKVKITARTLFLDEYSKPAESKFLYCYKICIANEGTKKVKLLNRHWIIIDSKSKREEVKGAGVVGQQPELAPGESHEYFSFCNLETNFGSMEGSYEMVDEEGNNFLAEIPRFFLADNLEEFDRPQYRRGQIVQHKNNNFRGIIVDYDMYFINDEELYKKCIDSPAKDKPWYYILIDKANAISYVAQEYLEAAEDNSEIEHTLFNFFFDGFDKDKNIYKRNGKTWDHLKKS
jgi:ApaG protein